MLRFLHVLILNAWRGMRRANGTPALAITFIAVCVLFIGSNASARASLQTAMQVVGLPVSLAPDTEASSGTKSKESGAKVQETNKKSNAKRSNDTASKTKAGGNDSIQTGPHSQPQILNASVSLTPINVVPVCVQGVMTYNVQSAQVSLDQSTASAGNFSWSWETRNDSGTGEISPFSTPSHNQGYDAGVQVEQINSNDPSQPLISAAANANYSYSFRLDVSGPFAASSAWVSVPQSSSSTCP